MSNTGRQSRAHPGYPGPSPNNVTCPQSHLWRRLQDDYTVSGLNSDLLMYNLDDIYFSGVIIICVRYVPNINTKFVAGIDQVHSKTGGGQKVSEK